jgi:hypothetical protein
MTLPLPACAALTIAALALSACGSDGPATAESTVAKAPARASSPGPTCPAQVGALVAALDSMRRQLAVGLSYEQYAAEVRDLRKRYARIPVERLTLDCLASAGTPAERALNKYIDGVNAWGQCLADASCTTASIEPLLQRKWRGASRFLSEAR